jgi:hypothetical protein
MSPLPILSGLVDLLELFRSSAFLSVAAYEALELLAVIYLLARRA